MDLEYVDPRAELLELRLDLMAPAYGASYEDTLSNFVNSGDRPWLVTLRSVAEGGAFAGTPAEAARILTRAAGIADAVDVEPAVLAVLAELGELDAFLVNEARIIVATHTHAEAGHDTEGSVVRKRAIEVNDLGDLRTLQEVATQPGFVVPFGRLGALRTAFVGGARAGLLYGADEGAGNQVGQVVPGQPTLAACLDELRAGEVTPAAMRYALIGSPPAHSPSPALHNAWFRATGRDALYIPAPLSVDEVVEARGELFTGVSVTMPYKRRAFELADVRGPWARKSGSVNTLVFRDGAWHGFDTDTAGILEHVELPEADGRPALVYGAGGYARAMAISLRERGWEVALHARREVAARELAAELEVGVVDPRALQAGAYALIANATPAGAGGPLPAPLADIPVEDRVVLDAPYLDVGRTTALVDRARAEGAAHVVDGRALLVAQGLGQLVAFSGGSVEAASARPVLEHAIAPPCNLVLFGLRGAGKTTVGRAVARRLGRPFVDLDEAVARSTGRTAAAWIRTEGIEAFRAVERRQFRSASARTGVVVAMGGGAIESESVRNRIAEHPLDADSERTSPARVLWLDVPPDVSVARIEASAVDRPRLEPGVALLEEARILHARRRPLGIELADAVIDATAAPRDVEDAVIRAWIGHATPRLS